jgi:hypothetical protein
MLSVYVNVKSMMIAQAGRIEHLLILLVFISRLAGSPMESGTSNTQSVSARNSSQALRDTHGDIHLHVPVKISIIECSKMLNRRP